MYRILLVAGLLLVGVCCSVPAGDKEKPAEAAKKRFAKLPEYVKERKVMHLVETLVEWREYADLTERDEVMDLVLQVYNEVDAKYTPPKPRQGLKKKGLYYPLTEHRGFVTSGEKDFWRHHTYLGETCVLRAKDFADKYMFANRQLVIASSALDIDSNANPEDVIFLTNARTTHIGSFGDCIVITTGSLDLGVEKARGAGHMSGVAVLALGSISLNSASNCVLCAGGAIKLFHGGNPSETAIHLPNDKTVFGLKGYSSAEDGLEAAVGKDGAVSVTKVADKKPFAAAGVKAGDVLLTVNGGKVDSLHELNRLLCRATVASGTARLKLRRGTDTEIVEVKLADW